jgi:hypothetical protein
MLTRGEACARCSVPLKRSTPKHRKAASSVDAGSLRCTHAHVVTVCDTQYARAHVAIAPICDAASTRDTNGNTNTSKRAYLHDTPASHARTRGCARGVRVNVEWHSAALIFVGVGCHQRTRSGGHRRAQLAHRREHACDHCVRRRQRR